MSRIVLAVFLVASFMGCDKSNSAAKKPDAPVKAESSEKTADDARKYVQEQIDRYLGGQQTHEQLLKITLGGFFPIRHVGEPVTSITIQNALQSFSEKGDKEPNTFKITIVFSGAKWTETVVSRVSYHPEEGIWRSI